MSYDITLNDPVTKKTIEIDKPHFMTGGTYAISGTTELWLNITYNYSRYYYEATDGDSRFANDDYEGGVRYGIRGIYGKTGAESIPMLKDMISRIENKYKRPNGKWINTTREKIVYYDDDGNERSFYDQVESITEKGKSLREEKIKIKVNEGPDDDYWEATAGNAIAPLYKLVAMAEMRPDGIWDGD